MTVMLDPAVLKCPAGTAILNTLQKHDICYEIQSQVLPGIITFWREVTELVEKEPLQVSNYYLQLLSLLGILALSFCHMIPHDYLKASISLCVSSHFKHDVLKVTY